MEEIFGKKPWVKPLCTQSSTTSETESSNNETENYEPCMLILIKKIKKNIYIYIKSKIKNI